MAKFRITGPDGATYSVEAPDDASDQQVLEYVRANMGGGEQKTASLAPPDRMGMLSDSAKDVPPPPQLTMGERAADVVKSFGVGLGQGALGIGTLPGNVEQLARMGIDYGAQKLGYENPKTQSSGQWFPHYGDAKKAFEEVLTGKFYEPQTVPGEYARTAGEFAPAAFGGPGGVAARTARVAIPAAVSETAGQMTKGRDIEPWARMAGAMTPTAMRGATRAFTPGQPDANRAQHIAVLEREGINPTAGQRSGSRGLMYRESNARDTYGSGPGVRAAHELPLEQFTQSMMRRAGSNAPRATPDAINDTFVQLGQRFDQLGQNAHLVVTQPRLQVDLNRVVGRYEQLKPNVMSDGHPRAIIDDIMNGRAIRDGASYSAIRHDLTQQANALRHNDPALSRAYAGIRDALDAAVERGLPANQRGQYRQVRDQYRNLLAIAQAATGAGEDVASGLLTPQRMRQAMVGQDKRSYARGNREMDEITRAGNVVMPQLANSGTPARLAAMGVPAMLMGGLGTMASGNIAGAGALVAGPIGQALYARGLMSGPVQRYLSHQTQRPSLAVQGATMPIGPTLEDEFASGPIMFR